MTRTYRSLRLRILAAASAAAVFGFAMFAPVDDQPGSLGIGQRKVTAQAALALAGTTTNLRGQADSSRLTGQVTKFSPQEIAARRAAAEAHMDRRTARMASRADRLPASDPRVKTGPPPDTALQTIPRGPMSNPTAPGPQAPGPQAPGRATYFRASQLVAPAGFGYSVNSPAVAQNGKDVIMTWNSYGAVSLDGAQNWTYFDPAAFSGMSDFCCKQDVIFDKGTNRAIWERLGFVGFSCGPGCSQNRVLITVLGGFNFLDYTYDLRGTTFGLTNAVLDDPRLALSDKFLYITFNVFDWGNRFLTHLLVRLDLVELSTGGLGMTYWTFADGWSPALVENAREVMYMGDQIVTNKGLNDQFRVYWIFDDSTMLFSVNRTVAPYLFTDRYTAMCTVPGGFDPCMVTDQRITGAVLGRNTPLPGDLGVEGDRIDFFWNVRAGNGFKLPYVESAGFLANTIQYVQRKSIFSDAVTWFYAGAGANDRGHVGLSLMGFFPESSKINPYHFVAIDDDYNGNPPGWELYSTYGGGPWVSHRSGEWLRARLISPAGIGWVASGYSSVGSEGNYRPHYIAFGRERDTPGFARFDQQ